MTTKLVYFSIFLIHSCFYNPTFQQTIPVGAQQQNVIQQTIYQFLKSNQLTNQFAGFIDQITQQTGDNTLYSVLAAQNTPGQTQPQQLTVFVPVNSAFSQAQTDFATLANDLSNMIIKTPIPIEQLRQMNGQNITQQQTYGFRPRLSIRVARSIFSTYSQTGSTGVGAASGAIGGVGGIGDAGGFQNNPGYSMTGSAGFPPNSGFPAPQGVGPIGGVYTRGGPPGTASRDMPRSAQQPPQQPVPQQISQPGQPPQQILQQQGQQFQNQRPQQLQMGPQSDMSRQQMQQQMQHHMQQMQHQMQQQPPIGGKTKRQVNSQQQTQNPMQFQSGVATQFPGGVPNQGQFYQGNQPGFNPGQGYIPSGTQQFPIGQSPYLTGQSGPMPGSGQSGAMPGPGQPGFNQQFPQTGLTNGTQSVYEVYSQMYYNSARSAPFSPLGISPKLPIDETFFINGAVVTDYYQLLNGFVYFLNAYPRFYDKSFLALLTQGDVTGLAQQTNFWINRVTQSVQQGDESLRNALNAFGPNTYFIPMDSAMSQFVDQQSLQNNSFLLQVLLRSHRVSNSLLFDYYLTESNPTVYTDVGLPVSTAFFRTQNGQLDIRVAIGHIKGRIHPVYRNIHCASGVVHLVDTVMAIPYRNAYQEIASRPDLTILKSLIDQSSYATLLNQPVGIYNYALITNPYNQQGYLPGLQPVQRMGQTKNKKSVSRLVDSNSSVVEEEVIIDSLENLTTTLSPDPTRIVKRQASQPASYFPTGSNPGNYNQFGYSGQQIVTILAPVDSAFAALTSLVQGNQTAIDAILAQHVIVNSQNVPYYTEHDQNLFQNGQTYGTVPPGMPLTATVQLDPKTNINRVSLFGSQNQVIQASIVYPDTRVSNGAIHVIDRVLTAAVPNDITNLLNVGSSSPQFSQFVQILMNTGIFNDLNHPSRQFTLFIPTNNALSRYQTVLNSGDINQQRNLVYRHLCLDQNLASTFLATQNQNQQFNQQPMTAQSSLMCQNALGQQLTVTKDEALLVTNPDAVSSKVINDYPGLYSSAYVLENTLLNSELPDLGLTNKNSAPKAPTATLASILISLSFFLKHF